MRSSAFQDDEGQQEVQPLTGMEASGAAGAATPTRAFVGWRESMQQHARRLLDQGGAPEGELQALRSRIEAAFAPQPQGRLAPQSDDATATDETVAPAATAQGGGGGRQLESTDVQATARWVEDTMPFLILLLVVFLYRHLISILTFFWLTSMLHSANERMRRQTILKENRSRSQLLMVAGILLLEITAILILQGQPLMGQLQFTRIADFNAAAPALSMLLWDVLLADLCVRSGLLLLKIALALVAPIGSSRRLKRVFSAVEAVGFCYRGVLPMPLWFHWLFHAAEDMVTGATLWSVGCSHLYVGFKLVSLVDRTRKAAMCCRSVLWFVLPMGKYASAEEVMETGEDGW